MTSQEPRTAGLACSNCGEPTAVHCRLHVIPCCPHYPQHEAANGSALDPADILTRVVDAYKNAPDPIPAWVYEARRYLAATEERT